MAFWPSRWGDCHLIWTSEIPRVKERFLIHHPYSTIRQIEEMILTFAAISAIVSYVQLKNFLTVGEWNKKSFFFIKRVDEGWITTVKDLESWRFER